MNIDDQLKKKEVRENSNKYIVFLELATEIIAWFAIVISLSFFGGILAGILYLIIAGKPGLIIAAIISGTGVIASIIYACYIWKTKGTVNFISNSSSKYNNTDNPE